MAFPRTLALLAAASALVVACGRGARLGVFIKGDRALESSRSADIVVLDKTGTVTTGRMMVTGVRALGFGVAVEPAGAFYVLANARRWTMDSTRFAYEVLEGSHVALTPGDTPFLVSIKPCTIHGWRPFSVRNQPAVFIKKGAMANQVANNKNHRDRSRLRRQIAHPPHRAKSRTREAI